MGDRRMASIFPECDQLKQNYDKCFTEFFQKFIAPNYRHKYAINPCDRLHQAYRECVEQMESLQSNLPHPQIISDTGESRFNQLERTLEQFQVHQLYKQSCFVLPFYLRIHPSTDVVQENARHLGVIATDFGARSQEPFNQKIHTLVSGLQELDQMRNQFADVKVPLELLDVLDQGKNPQLYTKEVLERTLQKNKEVNGKVETYKKFHAALLKELGEEMPEDTMTYRNIRDILEK
ncbi:hypothetical protein NECAME_06640 [Necator americanus]|uniref:Mediator of RNA polymerase II transcription subunit 10 n=2 Tax=Ancylostomatidae TaxID=33278 RepID=W2TUU6_NECAM|nr:hypothetical protein NECAME_06640 [Necator americanus]ETN84836.1 hypothetical protein NECAME_06640 [Necator americanus]